MPTYEDLLATLADQDRRIVVMTAENRAAIRGLPARLGDRFIDVGICEQTMIGAAAGLALRGRIPVCHALATFLTLRAFEFIRTDVGIARLPVKLVGAVPGFLSEANGPTHQAIEDIALMRAIVGMQIVCPADEAELLAAMPAILATDAPCYVRFNAMRPAVEHSAPFEMGRAEVLSEGGDVSLLTYGLMLREADLARQHLEDEGLRVRLVNLRTLRPIDARAVLRAAAESKLIATVEDHLLVGGLYSIVCEILVANEVRAKVLPIALDSWFKPALLKDALAFERFDGASIAARVVGALRA
jgi:transketolase